MEITTVKYINLQKNWHRKLMITSLLRKLPYRIVRCPGVVYDFDNDSFKEYVKYGFTDGIQRDNRIKGVAGCWIAHSKALEDVTEKAGVTVVLEDDFVCEDSFFKIALKMVEEFEKDFDVILFDTWGKGPLERHKISQNIYKPGTCNHPYYSGTHCLFVKNSRIPKILNLKLSSQIQDYDVYLNSNPDIESYIFYTGLCGVRNVGSDIYIKREIKFDIPIQLVKWTLNRVQDMLRS